MPENADRHRKRVGTVSTRKIKQEATLSNVRTKRNVKINCSLKEKIAGCNLCFGKQGIYSGPRLLDISGNVGSPVTLVYTADLCNTIEKLDLAVQTTYSTYLEYMLALIKRATGYDLMDLCICAPLTRCQEVRPTKVKVKNCAPFFTPFRTSKIIVIGKGTASTLLFDGYSPPDMRLLNGRPVVREDKEYLIFQCREFIDSVFDFYNPQETHIAQGMIEQFVAEVADRSVEKLTEWFG